MNTKTVFNRTDAKFSRVQKSKFDLGYRHNFDIQIGNIVPFDVLDVIPGDEVNISPQVYGRFAPLVTNPNTEISINLAYFYVPYRLVAEKFNELYMGDGTDIYTMPHLTISSSEDFRQFYKDYGILFNYFGLPQNDKLYTTVSPPTIAWYPQIIALAYFRAYAQIYFYYFLDHTKYSNQDIQQKKQQLVVNTMGAQTRGTFLTTEGRFNKDFNQALSYTNNHSRGFFEPMHTGDWHSKVRSTADRIIAEIGGDTNTLRTGQNLQKFYTNLLNAKTNMLNYSRKLFGVSAPDVVEQPVLLGSSKSMALIGDVIATTENENTGQPLGSYAGKGYSQTNGSFRFNVPEFGIVMGLCWAIPEITYTRAMSRGLSQIDAFDFVRPELQNNYFEDIKGKEMYCDYISTGVNSDAVVGFTPPYNHFRFASNKVTGRQADDLQYWNVVNIYASSPTGASIGKLRLSTSTVAFEKQNNWQQLAAPMFAINSEPHIYIQADILRDTNRVLQHVQQNIMI